MVHRAECEHDLFVGLFAASLVADSVYHRGLGHVALVHLMKIGVLELWCGSYLAVLRPQQATSRDRHSG
jgi:hypothetical protein